MVLLLEKRQTLTDLHIYIYIYIIIIIDYIFIFLNVTWNEKCSFSCLKNS